MFTWERAQVFRERALGRTDPPVKPRLELVQLPCLIQPGPHLLELITWKGRGLLVTREQISGPDVCPRSWGACRSEPLGLVQHLKRWGLAMGVKRRLLTQPPIL